MLIADFMDGLMVLSVAGAIYFAPTVVAFMRGVSSPWSIVVINTLLGWTLIGWVVALAMAVRSTTDAPVMPSAPVPDMTDRIGKLADLHREGLLSDDEYNAAKQRLLT